MMKKEETLFVLWMGIAMTPYAEIRKSQENLGNYQNANKSVVGL